MKSKILKQNEEIVRAVSDFFSSYPTESLKNSQKDSLRDLEDLTKSLNRSSNSKVLSLDCPDD